MTQSPQKKLHFGKKSLGLWLQLTKDHGSLIKAFNSSPIHIAYDHYPSEDFVSNNKRLQYFYHSHRDSGEHGHIHIFNKSPKTAKTNHLLAIGLSEKGLPLSLFTVTDETVKETTTEAKILKRQLSQSLRISQRETTLTNWITSFCNFYKENIIELIEEKSISKKNSSVDNDISSFIPISWEKDLEICEKKSLKYNHLNHPSERVTLRKLRQTNSN